MGRVRFIYSRGHASRFLPKAACVERLSTLQTSSQIFKVISKLLVLSKLHHIIEVLHMLDNCVQLENTVNIVNTILPIILVVCRESQGKWERG